MVCQTIRVLAVDDNEIDIGVIHRYLKTSSTQFLIQSADTLNEAIAQIAQCAFDVILLDLCLPDSEGLDTLQTILACQLDTPIIVLTGSDDEQTALELIRVGAQAYLAKWELSAKLLIRTIHHTIEKAAITKLLKQREQQLQQEIARRIEVEKGLEREVQARTQDLEIEIVHQHQLQQECAIAQLEVARRELQLQQFVKHMPAAVAMFDTQMRYLFHSDRWVTAYNLQDQNLVGKKHDDVFPDMPAHWRENYQTCLTGKVLRSDEDSLIQQDGTKAWFKWEIRPWYEPSGKIGGLLMLTEMITTQKQAQLKLQESESRFRAFMDHSFAATFMKDISGRYIYVNPQFKQLAGQNQSDLLHKTDAAWLPPDIAQQARQHDIDVLETGKASQRLEMVPAPNGTPQYWMVCKFPCPTDGQTALGGIAIDVTESRTLSERLAWQASHDELTGLKNRRYFELKLSEVFETSCRKHILCFLDLDQFKVVNDTCGHAAGDELLKQVGAILSQNVRSVDIVARLGGDEFGILLDQCSLENARSVMDAIRQTIQDFRFAWQGKTFGVGVSIGLVEVDDNICNLADALGAADTACYAAKERGRNRIYFYRADDQELSEQRSQQQWIARIQQALDENQFQLYQQPIAPASIAPGGAMHHHEILLRLVDATGIVPPMAFIPAAERYGLMPAIDRWVIQAFFSQIGTLQVGAAQSITQSGIRAGFYTINLSGASINDEQFLPFLKQQIEHGSISPEALCFEVTETVAVSNLNRAREFISETKALGCSFALDDFGSGMSSFGYLQHLAVDYVKIDGSFVRNLLTNEISTSIVEAITKIAHSMGLETIAERVEDLETQRKLQSLEVDYVQGYGIGKPAPLFGVDSGAKLGGRSLVG